LIICYSGHGKFIHPPKTKSALAEKLQDQDWDAAPRSGEPVCAFNIFPKDDHLQLDIWAPGNGEGAPAPIHTRQAPGPGSSSQQAASRTVFSDILFPTRGRWRRARGGWGILPPLPTSFSDNHRLNALGFDIKETSRILQNNSKEPSSVHNLPIITKWLPLKRLGHMGLVRGTASQASGT